MKKLTAIIISLVFLLSSCKQYRMEQAQVAEDDLNYEKAIYHYEKLAKKHQEYQIYKNLSVLYLKRGEFEKAKLIYDSLIFLDQYPKKDLLAYAEVLMATENYSEAKIWVDRYINEVDNDEKALSLKKVILNQGAFLVDTSQYSIELIDIPATPQTYAAVPYNEGIIYSGKAKKDERGVSINPWDGWPYSRLYYVVPVDSGWSAPYELSNSIDESYHVGPTNIYFGKRSPTLILSKSILSDYKSAKKNPIEKGIIQRANNNIQLYSVGIQNMKLDTPEIISFCKPEFNYAQASLNPEGNMMVFTSDLAGGMGGSDLYISFLNEGSWSDPVNLGSRINTEKNESFPNLVSEDTLYFSSEAHNSYGGLDIFYTIFDGEKWTKAHSLLYPLNSYQDDFAITFKNDKNSGYISSNRSGLDQIYSFTINRPSFRIEGLVVDKVSQTPMRSVKITMINRATNKDTIVYSDSEGKFDLPISSNSKYKVKAEEDDYFTISYNVSTRGRTQSKSFHVVFEMEKVILNKPIKIDNAVTRSLDPENTRVKSIYYDFDKWDIRNDAIIELDLLVWRLKDNPNLVIEISSHTDSRGSDDYNLNLSQKRADGVVAYLIDRGVNPDMLIAKGYGESQLINACKNGVNCSEEEHQENRRSEFKVIEIKD